MNRKIEQSVKTRRNKRKIRSRTGRGREKETSSEVGEKWTESFCRNRERGLGWAWAEGCEVLSPEQTEANRGAVVCVRVGQGRGQQHRDVKCDRSILGLQHRSPSLL